MNVNQVGNVLADTSVTIPSGSLIEKSYVYGTLTVADVIPEVANVGIVYTFNVNDWSVVSAPSDARSTIAYDESASLGTVPDSVAVVAPPEPGYVNVNQPEASGTVLINEILVIVPSSLVIMLYVYDSVFNAFVTGVLVNWGGAFAGRIYVFPNSCVAVFNDKS